MTEQIAPPPPAPAADAVNTSTNLDVAAPAPTKKGFAVTALVLGIVAIVGSWVPLLNFGSIAIGVVGAVFGIVAIILAVTGKAAGKVMAIIGAVLAVLAIVISVAVNSAAARVVDTVVDEAVSVATSTPKVEADAGSDTEGEEATEEDPADAVGTMDTPAAIGDGTVWSFESGGNAWDVTFDVVEIVTARRDDGDVAVLTGTATPTAIETGSMSNWASFPMFDWIADGFEVEDTWADVDRDDYADYRHTTDLKSAAGTTMKFYTTIGLPDGVVPDLVSVDLLFGSLFDDNAIYFSTGL